MNLTQAQKQIIKNTPRHWRELNRPMSQIEITREQNRTGLGDYQESDNDGQSQRGETNQ